MSSFDLGDCRLLENAGVAQLVERDLAKVEAVSSNLIARSIFFTKAHLAREWETLQYFS